MPGTKVLKERREGETMRTLFAFLLSSFLAAADLLQPSQVVYEGSFRVPTGKFGSSSFAYGGTAIGYNPARDSLYMVGHDWDQAVAEISIPTPSKSSVGSLPTATVLQSFSDPSEGKAFTVDNGTVKIGGLYVHNGLLIGTAYSFYDAEGNQTLSHFTSTLSLSTPGDARGMYQVGTLGAGFTAGYMCPIPQEWQAQLGGPVIVGQAALSIISRTSSGPAAFAFDPADLGVKNPVPVSSLVYYPLATPLAPSTSQNDLFTLATTIKGVCFPAGFRSVLFWGTQGTGPYCYGDGAQCGDPDFGWKGPHAYPYRVQIWAYDALDLVAVKSGAKQPWSLRPYGVWPMAMPFGKGNNLLGGVATDSATGRVYVSQQSVVSDGFDPFPVVHVYSISGGTVVVPPPPPPPDPVPVVPTKIVLTWSHTGRDINNAAITIDKTEVKIVKRGAGSGSIATATFYTTASELDLALVSFAVQGDFDAHIRAHSAQGWSSYTPAIPFVWPPSEPQPAQVAPKLTSPSRPFSVKAEAKP